LSFVEFQNIKSVFRNKNKPHKIKINLRNLGTSLGLHIVAITLSYFLSFYNSKNYSNFACFGDHKFLIKYLISGGDDDGCQMDEKLMHVYLRHEWQTLPFVCVDGAFYISCV
jgi:hypothetical protein